MSWKDVKWIANMPCYIDFALCYNVNDLDEKGPLKNFNVLVTLLDLENWSLLWAYGIFQTILTASKFKFPIDIQITVSTK